MTLTMFARAVVVAGSFQRRLQFLKPMAALALAMIQTRFNRNRWRQICWGR